jgi:hypothetical protein
MNKERPDSCRILFRVEQRIVVGPPVASAIERTAFAPAAATDDHPTHLCDKVSAIVDELQIDAEYGSKCRLNLCERIDRGLKRPGRNPDE